MKRSAWLGNLKWTLRRKLFGYMLLLTALLLLLLVVGLFLFGRFNSTEKTVRESLELQMDIFEKDVFAHFDDLAAAGIRLSGDVAELLDEYLEQQGMDFAALTDAEEHIAALQSRMIGPLRDVLLQEHCSGVFVMLDTTVNSGLEHAESSRAGLYLQINGYGTDDRSVLLYRGRAQVGKRNGIMPHRKWRQEFDTGLFDEYDAIMAAAALSSEQAYRFTDMITLPGTSDKAVLVVVPMTGADGTVYGLCGYEISASYFMTYHAQMTRIQHMTGLMSMGGGAIDADSSFSCGVDEGFYRAPQGLLTVRDAGSGMLCFDGDAEPYIGVQRTLRLSPNNGDVLLSVMMPKADYDRQMRTSVLQNVALGALMLFFAVNCCMFFSKRFLAPVLEGLEQVKAEHRTEAQSQIAEINDLFAYLAQKDRAHEEALRALEAEKLQAQQEKERLHRDYEKAQNRYEAAYARIKRLESAAGPQIDPESYQLFLEGIQTLTATERKIFDYYLSGYTVAQIMEIASIKESTLRYHNRNIYNKLGVNSLKQLLRYAELRKQEEAAGTHS